MRKAILSLILVAFVAGNVFATAADIAPDVLAKKTTDEVLAILRTNNDIRSDPKKVTTLVEEKVLPHFDFTKMTRLAVGKGWRQASPEQQQTLVTQFKNLLVRTYGSSLTMYKNEAVDFKTLQLEPNATDVMVKSQINRSAGGQPIAVDYAMEKGASGWKVYDVKIEGVSLVTTFRETFAAKVRESGVDGLIKALSDKNRQSAGRLPA